MVRRLPGSWSHWNLVMLVFEEGAGGGKELEYPEKKPPGARERTNEKLNSHYGVNNGIRTEATLVRLSLQLLYQD